jgi:hypothetical protein
MEFLPAKMAGRNFAFTCVRAGIVKPAVIFSDSRHSIRRAPREEIAVETDPVPSAALPIEAERAFPI